MIFCRVANYKKSLTTIRNKLLQLLRFMLQYTQKLNVSGYCNEAQTSASARGGVGAQQVLPETLKRNSVSWTGACDRCIWKGGHECSIGRDTTKESYSQSLRSRAETALGRPGCARATTKRRFCI